MLRNKVRFGHSFTDVMFRNTKWLTFGILLRGVFVFPPGVGSAILRVQMEPNGHVTWLDLHTLRVTTVHIGVHGKEYLIKRRSVT